MAEPRKELTMTRVVNASREVVFRAWTDPDLLVQWWGPNGVTGTECEVDPRVGGVFRIVMVAGPELGDRAGEHWPMYGTFAEFDPPSRIVIDGGAVDYDDGTQHLDGTTTVEFDDLGNGTTRLTLTAVAVGLTDEATVMLEGMTQGWTETLDKLVARLA